MAYANRFTIKALAAALRCARLGLCAGSAQLGRFLRASAGNVAITFALALAPLTAGVGGAIDFTRATTIASEIQNALDSGVLAAASLTQDRDPEAVVRAYVEAALSEYSDLIGTLEIEINARNSFNSREVSATASVAVPTVLLGIAGVKTLRVSRTSTALEEIRNIEISLVLDVSGSMGGSKIRSLRDAANEFVDVVLDPSLAERTSLSVIPYNGGVRLPGTVFRGLLRGAGAALNAGGCPDHGTDLVGVIAPGGLGDLVPLEWNGVPLLGNNDSSHCPDRSMESIFLQNDPETIHDLIDDLEASGNTGLDVATGWGVRALDPSWRGQLQGAFRDRPVSYSDEDTVKVLVIMTDGAATAQSRTRRNGRNWQTYTLYNSRTARDNMSDICEAAKRDGIVIYTIAFQLSGNTNRNLMRGCASRPATYYQVEGLDIGEAFAAIAADINQLRLSQ